MRKAITLLIVLVSSASIPAQSVSQQMQNIKNEGSNWSIIFVHGLSGHYLDTFRSDKSKNSWFDILSSDNGTLVPDFRMKDFDIFSLDYSKSFKSEVSVEEIATQITRVIEASPVLRDHNHVWMLGHSLGGILIKKVLINLNNEHKHRLIDRIVGVSLLAVPSQGAPLAETGKNLPKIIIDLFGSNARLVTDLQPTNVNTFLDSTENLWANFVRAQRERRPFPIISCAYEARPQFAGIMIVPKLYTSTTCDGSADPINGNHISLPKPDSDQDYVHRVWLTNALRGAIGKLETQTDARWTAEEPLGKLVNYLQRQRQKFDPINSLPLVDEEITVEADSINTLQRLLVAPGTYAGPTWTRVFSRIVERNPCVRISHDRSERKITVSVLGAVSCPEADDINSSKSYACSPMYCSLNRLPK